MAEPATIDDMTSATPLEIIRRDWTAVQGGSPDEFAALLNQLRPYLRPLAARLLPYQLAAKADESDIAQLATTRALLAIGQFNGDTPELFWAWLKAIQRNEVNRLIETYWAARRSVEREQALADAAAVPAPGADDSTAGNIAAAREAALRTLKPDDQTVIRLRLYEQKEYAAIAVLMGREYEAVKKLFARAVARWKRACDARTPDGSS